ncbi:MAG: nucleotidyl transferase AbiEii/AbiGii toxin family protein [Bacteroidales bacterium]|jgi:predicted nucleotidyltransferase component of viral defense system|nr:nucleotidyl transferase AbiEii/AbiGii toxin family protein [Bacteroidales bacterium]
MNLFEQTVEAVLANQQEYVVLRPALEKEILHQDILRALSKAGLLSKLTFIGGTCLRACYGSERLSEDLDFTGGFDFQKSDLENIGDILQMAIWQKYNLSVRVLEPVKEIGNTRTWKIKIITAPQRTDLPPQQINIDVCLLPSYERRPVMLKNYYGLEAGTSGLIILAESLPEILADKIIAIALRSNRVKNRDLWDIHWLKSRNITLSEALLKQKLIDRQIEFTDFYQRYTERLEQLRMQQKDFLAEMRRFLTPAAFNAELADKYWWQNFLLLLQDLGVFGNFRKY